MLLKTRLIEFEQPLEVEQNLKSGELGVILGHGDRSDIDLPILKSLTKELNKNDVSVIKVRYPFRVRGKRIPDNSELLDRALLSVWNWVESDSNLSKKKWAIGGHDLGAKVALRVSSLIMQNDKPIPTICLNFPMYPPNRPEKLNINEIHAIVGPVLFIQTDKNSKGTFTRLQNQLAMYASFCEMKLIKGGDIDFEIKGKPASLVAKWITNDILTFMRNNL